ncbi:MAG: 23S rRNA (pseudouridine(1915)-N(3))-methyltransferase RlmH [Oscillospiraceae bacterium]|jgi:23S rRNA (pseudouridine1915-N3)-methyltransferase
MFTVNIISVGKLKEAYLREAVAEYSKRLGPFCKLSVTELSEQKLSDSPSQKEIENALLAEGRAILSAAQGGYIFALCIEGRQLSSEELSQKFNLIALSGKSTVSFIIGSSFGLSDEVKSSCDFKLSMSKMTFPHQLVRVMLSEQIYRAFQINSNSKYHK